jgi:hypothetical protein
MSSVIRIGALLPMLPSRTCGGRASTRLGCVPLEATMRTCRKRSGQRSSLLAR